MHFSLFSCFSCVFHFSGVFHFSRVFHILFTFQVCIYIHMHHMHTCAPHASLNTCAPHASINTCAPHASLNTKLAFPMHSMKDQVKMRNLCWTSCFCCFSGAFHEKHTFYEKRTLFTKSAGDFHEKCTVFMKSIRFSPTKFMSFWVITKYRSFDTKDQIFYVPQKWVSNSFNAEKGLLRPTVQIGVSLCRKTHCWMDSSKMSTDTLQKYSIISFLTSAKFEWLIDFNNDMT